jgi:pimeloyl-ACP methyl ester carboxylesterase
MREHRVKAADGRTLRAIEDGDGPLTAVFHHGTPGSSALAPAFVEAAAELGLRLVSVDRAGYGGSDRLRGRTVADVATDIAAVLDALGIERAVTFGLSGGGPHALACAALLPDRFTAVAVMGGVAPWEAEGLDYFEGMAEANVVEFKQSLKGPEAIEAEAAAQAASLASAEPAAVVEVLGPLCSPPDQAVLEELGAWLSQGMAEGCGPGPAGWIDDDVAFVRPWGFDPKDVGVPVTIWHGEQDAFVPPGHARWLAGRIPGARLRLLPDHGHLSLVPRLSREILAELV